ncbi:MAG: hypothetical protein R3C56_20895 [Pirellulaceae bacterium]
MRGKGQEFEIGKKRFLDRLTEFLSNSAVCSLDCLQYRLVSISTQIDMGWWRQVDAGDEGELFGDDESDIYSQILEGQPVELLDHLNRVRDETIKVSHRLSLDSLQRHLNERHRCTTGGKRTCVFRLFCWAATSIGQSGSRRCTPECECPTSLQERDQTRGLADLPKGFRHELLSLALAESHPGECNDVEDAELLLHLIASHHGRHPWSPGRC